MIDDRHDDDVAFAGRVQRTDRSDGRVITQAEIDDVLTNEALSPHERKMRLGELRQRILDDEHVDGGNQYVPLQARIMDALSMLAEGGHDYDGNHRVESEDNGEDLPSSRSPSDADVRE